MKTPALDEKRRELASILQLLLATTNDSNTDRYEQRILEILKEFPSLAAEAFFLSSSNGNAENSSEDKQMQTPLLCLMAANNASLEIVQEVYHLYPDVVGTNSFPLHFACENYAKHQLVLQDEEDAKKRIKNTKEKARNLIEFWLQECPPMNTQKNLEGRLPIHCLLSEKNHPNNHNTHSEADLLKVIQLLLEANPEHHLVPSGGSTDDDTIKKNNNDGGLLPLELALLHDYPNDIIQYLAEGLATSCNSSRSNNTHEATSSLSVLRILGSHMDEERMQSLAPLLGHVQEVDIRVGHWTSRQAFVTVMKALLDHKDTIQKLTFYGLPGRIMEKTRKTRDLLPQYLWQAAFALQEATFSPGGIALGGDHTPEFAAIVNSICRPTENDHPRALHTLRLYNFEVGFLQPVLKLLSHPFSCDNLRTIELDCCDIELVGPDSWQKVVDEFCKESNTVDSSSGNSNRCENLLLSIDHTEMHQALISQIVSKTMPYLQTLTLNPCFIDQEEYPDWSVQWFYLLETEFAGHKKLSLLRIELFGVVQPVSLLRYLASSAAPSQVILCDLELKNGAWDSEVLQQQISFIAWEESTVESLTLSIKDIDGDYNYLKSLLLELVQKMPQLKSLNLQLSEDSDTTLITDEDPDPTQRIQDIFCLAQNNHKSASS